MKGDCRSPMFELRCPISPGPREEMQEHSVGAVSLEVGAVSILAAAGPFFTETGRSR